MLQDFIAGKGFTHAILTTMLYLVYRLTLSDMAAVATIFAGFAAGGVSLYRLWMLIRKEKKK